MPTLQVNVFGGLNSNDQTDALVGRAFSYAQDGTLIQQAPMESPNLHDVDFDPAGLRKRLGSTTYTSLVASLSVGETIIRGYTWVTPGTTTEVQLCVTSKSIWSDSG